MADSVQSIQLGGVISGMSSVAAGVGGASATLGPPGLTGYGAGYGGSSAVLSFHSDVMPRLAAGDYPAAHGPVKVSGMAGWPS